MQNDSTPHAHLIWPRPLRPCSPDAMSGRHSSRRLWSRAERSGTNITTNHLLLDIRSFWLLNPRSSITRMSHWKQIVGSGPSSPNSPCTHTMMGTRQDLQPSSSGALHAHGGTIMWLYFQRALDSPGRRSRTPLEHITSLQGSFAGSSPSS